jgi:hypothetical protein
MTTTGVAVGSGVKVGSGVAVGGIIVGEGGTTVGEGGASVAVDGTAVGEGSSVGEAGPEVGSGVNGTGDTALMAGTVEVEGACAAAGLTAQAETKSAMLHSGWW